MKKMPVLPGFKTERLFYEDDRGASYVIRRENADRPETALLKTIIIDADNCADDAQYQLLFNSVASACLDNQKISSDFIAAYEETRYIRRADGKGCDIFVRSELLTPLSMKWEENCAEDRVIQLAKDICRALIECEKHGIVHGSINEKNIFVLGVGRYKLGNIGIDLAFAKNGKAAPRPSEAPETKNGRYDNRTDIYALGCIMRKMLMVSHLNQKAEDRSKRIKLNDILQAVIAKACAIDPERRYQTARQMLDDLDPVSRHANASGSFKRTLKTLGFIALVALLLLSLVQLVLFICFRGLNFSNHEHDYNYPNSDSDRHWIECSCGEITDAADHSFNMRRDSSHHFKECTCGRIAEYEKHVWASPKVVTEATEEAEGLRESVCKICDYSKNEVIPKLEHEHRYSDEWSWDEDSHWNECNCLAKGNMAAHGYGEWTETQKATIVSAGKQERSCDECGYVEVETIPKISHTHSYTGVWIYDGTSHWYQCSCGDKKDMAIHTYGAWVVTKQATIQASGLRERSCTQCRYVESEEIPNIPHTHSATGLWISNGTAHWHQCACGHKSDVASHSYGSWSIIKEATATETGRKRRTCSVCGYWQTEVIPTD